jgi:hypothetical protein
VTGAGVDKGGSDGEVEATSGGVVLVEGDVDRELLVAGAGGTTGSGAFPLTGAWASKRESADGLPEEGEELDRARTGKRVEVGGLVAPSSSSSTAAGGPGGRGAVSTLEDGSEPEVVRSGAVFLPDARRFEGAGWVQSSTSSM